MKQHTRTVLETALVVTSLLLLIVLLVGCATTLTPEEQEYNRGVDLNNWDLCERVYVHIGQYTMHFNHEHKRYRNLAHVYVVQDLAVNHCRILIKCKYWENHIGTTRVCRDE